MAGSGDLSYRLRFEQRGLNDNGDRRGAWAEQFTVWADIDYQRGSETAVGQRIEGKQPASITVMQSPDSKRIAASWRAVRVDTGETFNITSPAVPGRKAGFLNCMGVSGGASG
ncbi:head-tail adaptor protein [Asticcacaulis excentricus]|uniref:Head-tail joining family protein n=1 Tax=Asticcacaulis excentricus (strain ATCC 15261 / DSM 4724 / KCTC 12464 / NCIMB 9791 / VKM B-1370 / CB 48) TaxID=573065 RepID=E8RPQ6_ASTEC|nr:head-tail adaptor protein [Asticcacaulis excentricus]ADU12033.1 head-tail joining family protein [Asticcacaulis excentricus CB 48]